jgi:hypothetical protein
VLFLAIEKIQPTLLIKRVVLLRLDQLLSVCVNQIEKCETFSLYSHARAFCTEKSGLLRFRVPLVISLFNNALQAFLNWCSLTEELRVSSLDDAMQGLVSNS